MGEQRRMAKQAVVIACNLLLIAALHGVSAASNSTAANHITAQHLRTLAANGPEPHIVIMSSASCAYRAMLLNYWLAWERLGRSGQVLIIAEDKCTHDFVTEEIGALHVIPAMPSYDALPQDVSGDFGTANFNTMCNRRLAYILHALQMGLRVLFQDLDSVFFEDPFKYMPLAFDLVATHDGNEPYPAVLEGQAGEVHVCACLMLFTPSWGTIKFMHMWMAAVEARGQVAVHDQISMQELLSACRQPNCHLRALVMPSNVFPSGALYEKMNENERKRVAWVHANWRTGTKAKVKFLKKAGAWVLRDPPAPPPQLPRSPPS